MAFSLDPAKLAKLPEAEQHELQGMLAELSQAVEQNPLNGYVPHTRQVPFHGAKKQKRAFVGGNRSGKTTAGVADDLIQLLPRELVPAHLHPYKRWHPEDWGGVSIRVITPDLGFTMEAVLEKFRELTPKFALKGGSWDKGFDKSKRILRFECGSQVDFMSTEQDPDKFGGVKRHRIHYDEEPGGPNGEKIYKESSTRLIDYHGDEIWTLTPLLGMSWVYDKLKDRAHLDPNLVVFQVDMDDNPHLDAEGKRLFLSGLTDEELRVRKSGEFVALEGLFYPEFTDDLHVVEPITREHLKEQDVVVGIDPGLTRTAVVWVAFDNDNVAIVFEELYLKNLVVTDVCDLIRVTNAKWKLEPSAYIIDPSARNRSPAIGQNIESEYMRNGIYCAHGEAERGAGILEVKRRLQHSVGGSPAPALLVARGCKNLIWEFGRYRMNPETQNEWDAIKVDDHALDALRYVCMSRTWFSPEPPGPEQPNYDPMYEPPWRGAIQTDSPPMGAWS